MRRYRFALCVPYHRLRFPGGPPCAAVCGLLVLVLAVAPFSPSPSGCTTDPLAHLNCGRLCNTRPRLAADPHRESRPRHSMTEGMWLWLGTMRKHHQPTPQRARFALIRASRCSNVPRQLPLNVSRILGTGEICPRLSLVGTSLPLAIFGIHAQHTKHLRPQPASLSCHTGLRVIPRPATLKRHARESTRVSVWRCSHHGRLHWSVSASPGGLSEAPLSLIRDCRHLASWTFHRCGIGRMVLAAIIIVID